MNRIGLIYIYRVLCISVALLALTTQSFAFELSSKVEQNVTHKQQYQKVSAGLFHTFDTIDFISELSFYTDNKYSPAMGGNFYSGYFYLEKGGLKWNNDKDFIRGGRFSPEPTISSPYSLFVSSEKNPIITSQLYLEKDMFFYSSQWLQLNFNSTVDTSYNGNNEEGFSEGFPDRGAQLRTYGIKLGNLRFGYQDAAVYIGRSFDIEYFVNPLPTFFIQYANISSGKPWQHNYDENAIIGFFADYTLEEFYIYSQLLLDDVNTDFLFKEKYTNPFKMAWSLGGKHELPIGTFGLYHAGATKYTFQPSSGTKPYGYTYYPDTVFTKADNSPGIISLEENYIGYKHGENNLGFAIMYIPEIPYFNLIGTIEFVLSGSKSPVNPWHQYTSYTQGGEYTKMFTDLPLEKRITCFVDVNKKIRGGFDVYGKIKLGYVWNILKLHTVSTEYIETELGYSENTEEDYNLQYLQYFKPSENSEPIVQLTLGVQYSYTPFN